MDEFERYFVYLVNDSEKRPVQLENLYQLFKERLLKDLAVASPELLNYAELIERT
jgi:hypothetical protein